MRRGFSIYLILFFGFGPLSALAKGSDETGLPACCRRHGAHHCAMYAELMAMRARLGPDPTPRFESPSTCPLFPGLQFGMLAPAHALAAKAANDVCSNPVLSLAPPVAGVFFSSQPGISHAGRGPPTGELS